MRVLFPFQAIEKNSEVILYGAGAVGYEFYRQIKTTGYCKILAWVDRQYEWYRHLNLPVDPVESINLLDPEKYILAVERSETAESIRNDLLARNVSIEKIYWQDYFLKEDIVAKYNRSRVQREACDAVTMEPLILLTQERLDIVIRVMYAQDLLHGIENGEGFLLYVKMLEHINGFHEDVDNNMLLAYFSDYFSKDGSKMFVSSFKELLASMQSEGFRREFFIPLDRYKRLMNGAHRCAAAIALGLNVYVREYPFDGLNFCYPDAWLEEHGFTSEEREKILNKYMMLKQ